MKRFSYKEIPVPASVYRLQFNSQFNFSEAIKILPYLKELGVEGVYCSPYFRAFSGHGYDITDPNVINPAIGTEQEYLLFCAELKRLNLLHIVDIVPNHMGIQGGQNKWWQDVLENGPYSAFASYFDINWSPEKRELQNRVLLPVLGEPYGKILENQGIVLQYNEGGFFFSYESYILPAAPHTYAMILENELEKLKDEYKDEDSTWQQFQELISLYRLFPLMLQERETKKKEGATKLKALFDHAEPIRKHILHQVEIFNGQKKNPPSFDLLDKLLEGQFYRLSYWRVARDEINYRRFFNISELVSIRIEEKSVFEEHHRRLFELIQAGHIQGIRIDHPDGLYNPDQYFDRLRNKFKIYTIVEKILGRKEQLPDKWEVDGTVGYEYLNYLNGIFIQKENKRPIEELYAEFIGEMIDFETILYESKKFFTDYRMVSEVDTLGLRLDRLSENDRHYRDFTRHELTVALAEIISFFPIYRTYIDPGGCTSRDDCHYVKIAIEKAKQKTKEFDAIIFDFLEKILMAKIKEESPSDEGYIDFALRFQQLTSPIMAKGLEDTSFYIYNNFLSLNEVGGYPLQFGYSLQEFHTLMKEKKENWPYGFVASSTHDTKRSEDVRMRLNVLSEIPDLWKAEVQKWAAFNSKYRDPEVSSNTEYYIYQTLLGVWPTLPFADGEYSSFCERIWQVVLKSIREAKDQTNWLFPNSTYEEKVHAFLSSILLKENTNEFLKMFLEFLKLIDRYGGWNSLSHAAVKIASPGVVDIYQGNEMLTYRLMDPDNRANIDFDAYKQALASVKKEKIERLFAKGELAKTKLALQTKALHFRLDHKDLFLEGEYIPLQTRGRGKDNLIAFMRKYEEKILIVIAGRFFTGLPSPKTGLPLGEEVWGDTEVLLPAEIVYSELTDLFTGKKWDFGDDEKKMTLLPVAKIFESLPVAFLT